MAAWVPITAMPNPAIHDSDERGRNIIKRWDSAGAARGSLDSVCEEIARRILPNYAGSFSSGPAAGGVTKHGKAGLPALGPG